MYKSNVYTKGGDKGTTSIFNGERINKDSLLINAIGNIDELRSAISVLYNYNSTNKEINEYLLCIQNTLWLLNAELAGYEKNKIQPEATVKIENIIDKLDATLKPNNKFLLLNNNLASSFCNFVRTISRRAERSIVTLNHKQNINPAILTYINRLADLFFIFARVLDKNDIINTFSDSKINNQTG